MMAENRTPPQGEILFYSGPSGTIKVEVLFEGETFWLSQRRMAELFGVDIRTINEHLQNIYETNELDRLATVRKFRMVQQEGGRDVARDIDYNNLDAIIAVGMPAPSPNSLPRRAATLADTGFLSPKRS